MNGVINLKKRNMILKKKSLRVLVPLDPVEGACYIELVRNEDNDDELDYIYQIVERECGAIKQFVRELHDNKGARRVDMSQGSQSHGRDCVAAWINKEVTIGINVHDKMSKLGQKGVGSKKLRYEVRARFGTISHKYSINEPETEGTVEFESLQAYKSQWGIHQ